MFKLLNMSVKIHLMYGIHLPKPSLFTMTLHLFQKNSHNSPAVFFIKLPNSPQKNPYFQHSHEIPMFFPKDVSSQGSSEDCWRISHHTYPTHISHHTYPTHIHHTTHIPHISIQNVSHQYVSHQCVSIQNVCISRFAIRIPPIRTCSTRIPPVRILCVSIQCVSIQKVCISRNRKRIPPIHIPPIRIFNTCPTSTDPFNAYPFKKFASAGMAMSMSITANHFIPLLLGGNGNEYKNFAFPSILCKIIN